MNNNTLASRLSSLFWDEHLTFYNQLALATALLDKERPHPNPQVARLRRKVKQLKEELDALPTDSNCTWAEWR